MKKILCREVKNIYVNTNCWSGEINWSFLKGYCRLQKQKEKLTLTYFRSMVVFSEMWLDRNC